MTNKRTGLPSRAGGFTLIEVMVVASISAILLTAMLGSLTFFSRSGISMGHHFEMEAERQMFLAEFAREVRRAEDAIWTDADTLVLSIGGSTVTFRYDAATATVVCAPAGSPSRVIASGVESFAYKAFDRDGAEIPSLLSGSGACKMIQVVFDLARPGTPRATSVTASPRYLLRNKPVSAP
ncbi:MAG: type II secretion system protein J [Opitutales bacterium]